MYRIIYTIVHHISFVFWLATWKTKKKSCEDHVYAWEKDIISEEKTKSKWVISI